MLLTCPVQTPEFLSANGLGVEVHISRDDVRPGWDSYLPFVGGVHLPYSKLNLAALDQELRQKSIQTIQDAMDTGSQYKIPYMVMHTCGTESSEFQQVGSYRNMIDSIGTLADYAANKGITLCIENAALHQPKRRVYGIFANEWFQIQKDVAHPNVLLTLDTSHAATSAAMLHYRPEDRFAYLYEYLKHSERIGRVHWSDSRLSGGEAYFDDLHLVPGQGDLPRDFHQKILALEAVKTLVQRCSQTELSLGLDFIETL